MFLKVTGRDGNKSTAHNVNRFDLVVERIRGEESSRLVEVRKILP